MSRSYPTVALVMITFFVISFITNILGSLNPLVSESFDLSKGATGLLASFFFFAYGVFSMPGGMLYEKFGAKKMMLGAFIVSLSGGFLVAVAPSFATFAISLFMIGSGMALLQVVINPMLRTAGGEEHFAFWSVAAQVCFAAGSLIAPAVFTYMVDNLVNGTTDSVFLSALDAVVVEGLAWTSMYWLFAVIALVMVALVFGFKFQKAELAEDERSGSMEQYIEMFKNPTVLMFFFGIFCYVGTEQGVSFWISQYLVEYHGMDSVKDTPAVVGNFWGFMTLGCLLGLALLKLLDSQLVLKLFTGLSMASLLLALNTSDATTAIWGFQMIGFFISVMWSIVFSLALNSLKTHHGAFAGILCTGIIGGAVFPPVVGALADAFGLQAAYYSMFLSMGYIMFIAFYAKPLVKNETIFNKKELKAEEAQA